MKVLLLLLLSTFVYSQDYKGCLENSILKENYYIQKNKLIKGISHGDINFRIELASDNMNKNVVVLKVSVKENSLQDSVVEGINCSKVCRLRDDNERFKVKHNIGSSDKNGLIYIDKNLKIKYISINYPGVMPVVIDYENLIQCR